MRLLDCNDASFRLWQDGEDTWSPGFAWFRDGRYTFGELAWQQARRAPRDINNRFWHRLSTQPLSPALGPARHTADLVHAHLEALLGDLGGDLTLAIPGAMESDQLSLLLGILQTLSANAAQVVHRSALIGAATAQSCAHVELHLHQASITAVTIEGGRAIAGDTQLMPGHGLLGLMDDMAERISEQFVTQTRFDPQRRAETEQTLYEQIPQLLRSLAAHSEVSCTVEGHTARIAADALRPVGTAFSKALAPLLPATIRNVALDALLSGLPGLQLDQNVSTVGTDAILASAVSMAPSSGGELIFQREAPCHNPAPVSAPAAAQLETNNAESAQTSTAPAATHLLIAGLATPLHIGTQIAEGVVVSGPSQVTIEPGSAALLNNQPTEGVILLSADDRLQASGVEVHFIAVEN